MHHLSTFQPSCALRSSERYYTLVDSGHPWQKARTAKDLLSIYRIQDKSLQQWILYVEVCYDMKSGLWYHCSVDAH